MQRRFIIDNSEEEARHDQQLRDAIVRICRTEDWVPGCGGSEVPFTSRSGRVLLYCWNRVSGKHAYLDVATDMILSDQEASAFMQMH